MLYYSEIKNKKVFTDDGLFVGKLLDITFTFADVAQVTKLLVSVDSLKTQVHVPVQFVQKMEGQIVLAKGYEDAILTENELYVGKNVVDKQIIDIEGRKVVRVNDVIIQIRHQKNIYITGVDIGLSAVLRWFGLEESAKAIFKLFGLTLGPKILSWKDVQPLELSEGKVVLNTQQEKLERFHPEDLADYLETTDIQNMIKTLDLVEKEFASEVIAEMNLSYQIAIFDHISDVKAKRIIEFMDPDEAVDVLLQLSDARRAKILSKMDEDVREELMRLINASSTAVGQFMTTEFLTVKKEDRVSAVLEKIRKDTDDFDFLFYIYVVNDKGQIIGVVSLHELLLTKPTTTIEKIMHQNIVSAYLNTPINTVLKRMITYKLYGLPVVTKDKKIVGIVLLDDVDEFVLPELQ